MMSGSRVGTPNNMDHSTYHRKSDTGRTKLGPKQTSSSSLEILPPTDGETVRPWSASSVDESVKKGRSVSRQSGTGSRVGGIDPSLMARTPTPTKQVTLSSVRRKTEGDSCAEDENKISENNSTQRRLNGYYGDVHAMSTKMNQPMPLGEGEHPRGEGYIVEASSSRDGDNPQTVHTNKKKSPLSVVGTKPPSHVPLTKQLAANTKDSVQGVKGVSGAKPKAAGVEQSRDDDDDDDNDDSDTEESEEERKAPTELLMEFLGCLMEKDYKNAEKLCKMVLLYEPENSEALKFKPLIEEKLQQDEQAHNDDADGDDDAEDEGSSDDDDEDDDDDDGDDSTEESSSEDDSEEEEEVDQTKPGS